MNEQELKQLNDELRLAGKAREVLNNDAYKAAFNQIEQALLGAMKSAAIADDKLRLRLLDKYESLQALKDCLQSMVNTGEMAEQQLRSKSISERVKEFLAFN